MIFNDLKKIAFLNLKKALGPLYNNTFKLFMGVI